MHTFEVSLKYFDLTYLCDFSEIKCLQRAFKIQFSLIVTCFLCDCVISYDNRKIAAKNKP